MTDNYFDEKMKAALDHIEPPFDPASWDALAQKMDALANPVPVDEVDKIAFRALHDLEAPFQPAHWHLLETQMSHAAEFSRRIVASKIAEIVLLGLLLWTFSAQIFGEKTPAPLPPKPKYNGPVAEAPADRRPRINAAPATAAGQGFSETILEVNALNVSELAASTANFFATGFSAENPSPMVVFAAEMPSCLPKNLAENAPPNGFAEPFAPLPALAPNALESIANGQPQFATFVVKKRGEKQFYISNCASLARNHIRTPYDADFQKEAYAQWTGGYGGGIAAGVRSGKWGAEAGIVYASKRYAPQTTIAITGGNAHTGYQGVTLAEVDLDAVSAPVQVSRQIARAGRTSLRARAGATANFAVQTAYRYREIEVPSAVGTSLAHETDREIGRGLLEGGSARKNTWLTADAGLRLEHRVNQAVTVFVEPVYSLAIAGRVGPKRAKFDGIAVNAGVMAML